jgi:hypothetical protein
MRTTLESAVGTGNAYTYSVKDPRSDRERYIREAPMDLRSSSQNHLTPGRGEAERTNRMVTTVRGRTKVSVRPGLTNCFFLVLTCYRKEHLK